jgi:hypothetical protein
MWLACQYIMHEKSNHNLPYGKLLFMCLYTKEYEYMYTRVWKFLFFHVRRHTHMYKVYIYISDPVARFHLRNGASFHRINWMANPSIHGKLFRIMTFQSQYCMIFYLDISYIMVSYYIISRL